MLPCGICRETGQPCPRYNQQTTLMQPTSSFNGDYEVTIDTQYPHPDLQSYPKKKVKKAKKGGVK